MNGDPAEIVKCLQKHRDAYCDDWLNARAMERGKTLWTEIVAHPSKMSDDDLIYYCTLLDLDPHTLTPRIEQLALA